MAEACDVGIVGFGPAGATLAALLAKRGCRVCIFDKHRDIFPMPRAIGMDHEAMRIFQRIGISDALDKNAIPYNPTVYLGVDGEPIQRIEITPPPNPLSWPPTSTFNQPALEETLRKHVAKQDKIAIYLENEIVECCEADGQVTLTARAKDGTIRKFSAKYAVASDGAESSLRRRFGISLEDLEFEEDWIVADVIVNEDMIEALPKTNVQYCDPRRPTTYVICPGRHRRWEFKILPGETFEGDISPDFLHSLLLPWLPRHKARIWRAAAYRFKAVVAEKWRAGRLLLAGDAAHLMPPFLGQGMCQGIRDAANLEWKLARVLSSRSPDGILDTYQVERRSHVYEVTKAAKILGTIIGELDPGKARARDRKLVADQGGSVKPKLRQAFIPGIFDGLLLRKSKGSGKVFPQPFVKSGTDWVRLDDLTESKAILVLKEAPHISVLTGLAALASAADLLLATIDFRGGKSEVGLLSIEERESILSNWFDAYDCAAVLVRPDHYVYGTTDKPSEAEALVESYAKALVDR
jgi:2-polyprenyl-6-methoxyphenol hydroxylase-like FAD-dependent oxidoreductase